MTDLDVLAEGARTLGVELNDRQFAQYQAYLEGLASWNTRTNLTSPAALADAERVHLLDSLTVIPIIKRLQPSAARLVDIGSGAGLPGLAIKIAMPHLEVVLIEATQKKAEFISWAASTLELENVEVLADRAEEIGRHSRYRGRYRGTFDVATARAVGPLAVVMELALPLCKVGGTLLAQRGTEAEREASEATGAARELGGDITLEWVDTLGGNRSGIVVVAKTSETPDRYPRRTGIPTKRPLA
ncbi:MAG: 16S rRNA (guanine(527)-N(7))-methyltransferase RsmG [Chloroflexi bacterium]|nr:16S rRNA (guanine(527)-N(7))-methyltransferase RsmG [Chloroflexota bacterium]